MYTNEEINELEAQEEFWHTVASILGTQLIGFSAYSNAIFDDRTLDGETARVLYELNKRLKDESKIYNSSSDSSFAKNRRE
jgi:hypothetical protein